MLSLNLTMQWIAAMSLADLDICANKQLNLCT